LLLRAALWVPITVLGALFFLREGFALSTDVGTLKEKYSDQEKSEAPAESPVDAQEETDKP